MKTTNEGILRDTLRLFPRHMVKALAAGAMLVAAALPLAVATNAGAATAPTLTHVYISTGTSPLTFGAGASGTLNFVGTSFANDGGNVTLSTTATGVSFSSVTETSATAGTASFSSTTAATPGTYSVTLTDDNGTSSALSGVLTVDADPVVTAVTPGSVAAGASNSVTITVTGSGFTSSPSPITVTNVTNGTTLAVSSTTYVGPTSETAVVTGKNSVNNAAATPGAYTVAVNNADGGSGSLASSFTVTGSSITNVSPSALAIPTSATTVTISGAGFEPGIVVTSSVCTGTGTLALTSPTLVSPSTLTATAVVGGTSATPGTCTIVLTNPSAPTGNGAVITGTAVFGVGQGATGGAALTSATLSPNAPITPGTSATVPETLTIVGTGFSSYTTLTAYAAGATSPDGAVTSSCTSNASGTTLTCNLVVGSGAVAGTDSIEVVNNSTSSSALASAFTVAGPVITSAAPAALAVGAKVGTVITLTGTGFSPSATLSSIGGGTGLAAVLQVTSATSATLYVTTAPTTTGTATFSISQNVSSGVSVTSSTFKLTIDAAPTVSSTVNKSTGAIYVGAGAVNVPITITGANFATGATVGSFKNAYGVADPGVTATVTAVTSGTITATVTIAATDTNLSDAFTVTNLDGGTAAAIAFGSGLYIAAAPTITSVSPATGTASGTSAFTITGTNFATGAVVTTTPTNGTCGVTTFVSSTTLTVSCTLGVAGTTATSLLVTNLNGGQATSAAILAAATAPAPVSPFTSGESGNAKVGTTSTIVVTGGGFYGQPKATSSAGIKAVVSGDTGTALTVQVTVSKNVPGEHTLTFTLANGSVFKANFKITK